MYVADDTRDLAGLILWASYTASDISDRPLNVLSVYARDDLATTIDDVDQHRSWLPTTTIYTEVEGNHWQFGHYSESQNQRPQSGVGVRRSLHPPKARPQQ